MDRIGSAWAEGLGFVAALIPSLVEAGSPRRPPWPLTTTPILPLRWSCMTIRCMFLNGSRSRPFSLATAAEPGRATRLICVSSLAGAMSIDSTCSR
ncbi:MAG TPA: hypothetical protein DCY82_17025 [Acidimicrobiaceae bacterium]|nr:hypothetical protein [Acidimicrobiaceae bacterium]